MSRPGEILLVDDTPDNLRVLGHLLREHGYTVRVAPSGMLALRSIQASPPDLILLDIRMPEMDGFETCRRLRRDPGMLGTPILFLSASDEPADRVASFQAGGQDFISKPFEASEVLARVATHLHLARTRRELDELNDRLAQRIVVEGQRRQEAEATAEDRQARLDLTLAAASLGTWEVDPADGSVTFDARARAILGLPPGQRPDWRSFLRLIKDGQQQGVTGRWERSRLQKDIYDQEGWWSLPDGDMPRRRIRLRGRPLPGKDGRDGEMVGVIWDVTDEHHLRERLAQRERLDSIGQLAGGVAHDFNNHLAVIVGELDVLDLDGGLTSEARSHLGNIAQATDSSIALIRELLSFARQRETVREPLDVADLIRRSMRLVTRALDPAISLALKLPEGAIWVSGDGAQLENALLNLCLNARDAMPHGGTLTLTAGMTEVNQVPCCLCQQGFSGAWVVIVIADSGTGISEEIRERIFEPFFTTKPEGKGTGLGLPSVIGCIATHGGHLTLDSTVGAGSRFSIYLPTCDPPTSTVPASTVRSGKAGNLLILDDQETVREVIAGGLRRLGWTVETYADPALALAAWHERKPGFSAALVDMAMPGMNGEAVFRAIRAKDPTARVVLMSGHTGGVDLDRLIADGLAGFVDKPVKLRLLADRLRHLISEPEA